MHIWTSLESVDKINSAILWIAAIIGALAAVSTIWNFITNSRTSKRSSILFVALTAMFTIISVYSGDHFSDLRKIKERADLIRLSNMSSSLVAQNRDKQNLFKRISDSELIASTAKSEAIVAKTEAADIKAKSQPRMLSKNQVRILHNEFISIHLNKNDIPVVIAAKMMDEESLAYSKQIYDAIKDTGWEIGYTPMSTHTFQGIAIFYNPSTKQSEFCRAVQDAFKKASINFTTNHLDIHRIPIQADNVVYIVVGYK